MNLIRRLRRLQTAVDRWRQLRDRTRCLRAMLRLGEAADDRAKAPAVVRAPDERRMKKRTFRILRTPMMLSNQTPDAVPRRTLLLKQMGGARGCTFDEGCRTGREGNRSRRQGNRPRQNNGYS